MESIGEMLKKAMADSLKDQERLAGAESAQELADRAIKDPDVQKFLKEHASELSKQAVQDSMTNICEFYLQKTSPVKAIADYQAELFMNGPLIGVRYLPTAAKRQRDEERAAESRIELIDMPKKLRRITLTDLDKGDPGRNAALLAVGKFLDEYEKHHTAKGLYLTGDFGVGKTYIMAGLANRVAKNGGKVIFLHLPTFISGLSSHFSDNSLQREIQRVASCDVLILDDIGAETLSQWSRDDVLGVILQARMDNDLATCFTSNMEMDDLEDHFASTKNAVDPVKAARLMQRVRYLAKEIIVTGRNRRLN